MELKIVNDLTKNLSVKKTNKQNALIVSISQKCTFTCPQFVLKTYLNVMACTCTELQNPPF